MNCASTAVKSMPDQRAPTERRSGRTCHEEISCSPSLLACMQPRSGGCAGRRHAAGDHVVGGPRDAMPELPRASRARARSGPISPAAKLTAAQFTQAVRKPWGIMPAYIESQISDNEMALLAALFRRAARGRAAGQMAVRGPGRRAARAGGLRSPPAAASATARSSTARARISAPSMPTSRGSRTWSTTTPPPCRSTEADARAAAGAHPHGQLRADPDVGLAAARRSMTGRATSASARASWRA